MEIKGVPGRFGFRALVNNNGIWTKTEGVFFTKEEVNQYFSKNLVTHYLWPIEEDTFSGTIYVPHPEELVEEN